VLFSASASASIIDDKSDFVGDFTVIDFETWANGTPIELEPGSAISILPPTYASLGVRVTAETAFLIGRSRFPHWIAAMDAGGSGTNAITDAGASGFLRFDFTLPVNAVGLTAINSTDGEGVSLAVFDAADQLIESVDFSGVLVDGSVPGADFGNAFDIEYGFVGLFTAEREVSYAVVSQGIGRFDDLHFGVIPEPTTLFLIAVGVIGMTCRRQVKLAHVRIVSGVCVTFGIFLGSSQAALAQNNISGHVSAWVDLTEGPICGDNGWPGCPPHAGLSSVNLEGVRVCVCELAWDECEAECAFTAFTNSDGTYEIPYAGVGVDLRVSVDLDGEFARVGQFELVGPGEFEFVLSYLVPSQEPSGPPYTGIDFVFNPDGGTVPFPERATAEVTAFHHATRAHDFFRDRQPDDLPDFTEIDTPVIVDTGMLRRGPCAYGYLAEDSGFLVLTPSYALVCANAVSRSTAALAYAGVAADARSLPYGYFSLGLAEAFALLSTNDPILYPNHHIDVPEGHRYDFPNVPRRSVADDCDTEGACHEILAGIWWDIKLNMEAKYAALDPYVEDECPVPPSSGFDVSTGALCGLEVARQLFVRWTLMTEGFGLDGGLDGAPAIALDLLRADDTNEDLTDGTPHCEQT